MKVNGKTGILIDYSEEGLQISTHTPPQKKRVDIQFNYQGKDILLTGIVQWIRKRYSIPNAYQIGCQLIDPPAEYFQFIIDY